ncbi:MAG: hypothetical protein JO079_02730, partial [Frankiaceae bacterium]|nr:hypothetical protein [Frankiaceae bacterium]
MSRTLRRVGAGALLVLMAGLTACSSPDPQAGKVDRGFVTLLQRTFANDWAQLSARRDFPFPTFDVSHPDPKLLPKVGAFLAVNLAVRQHIDTELRGLPAPKTGRHAWTQVKVYAFEENTLAARQIHAAEAGDVRGFSATVQLLGNLHDLVAAQLVTAG